MHRAIVLVKVLSSLSPFVLAVRTATHHRDSTAGTLSLTDGLENPLLRGWLDHVISFSQHLREDVPATSEDKSYKFEQKWFLQPVDHFNKLNPATFQQRYFTYDKYSRKEENYPLFVFCGGEQGDIYLEWDRYGFMVEVARQHGAKILWLEHRFFGQSVPFGLEAFQKRSDRVGLLSLDQSLADYASIIREHKGEGPVLTFGGSLSGTIAVLLRVQHPMLVDMAFGSSAPVFGQDGSVGQYAWRKRLTDNFAELGGSDCPDLVRKGFAAFVPGQQDFAKLRQAFHPCEDDTELQKLRVWDILSRTAWMELERHGTFVYPSNKSAIPRLCDNMRRASSSEGIFASVVPAYYVGSSKEACVNMTRMFAPRSGGTSSPGGQGWWYMSCTEVVHPIGANNVTDMFPPYNWTVEGLTAGCRQTWGVAPDAHYLENKIGVKVTSAEARPVAAKAIAVPGKILFTFGDYDPWTVMVPANGWADDVKFIRIPGGSHCSDLETPNATRDTPDMQSARKEIASVLEAWIAELRPLRRLKVREFGKTSRDNTTVGMKRFGGVVS